VTSPLSLVPVVLCSSAATFRDYPFQFEKESIVLFTMGKKIGINRQPSNNSKWYSAYFVHITDELLEKGIDICIRVRGLRANGQPYLVWGQLDRVVKVPPS